MLSLERERILPNGEKNKASKEMSNAIDSLKESSIGDAPASELFHHHYAV